jgi:hypothetical protein
MDAIIAAVIMGIATIIGSMIVANATGSRRDLLPQPTKTEGKAEEKRADRTATNWSRFIAGGMIPIALYASTFAAIGSFMPELVPSRVFINGCLVVAPFSLVLSLTALFWKGRAPQSN